MTPGSHPLHQRMAGDVGVLFFTPLRIQVLILYLLHDFNSLLTGLPLSSLHLSKLAFLLFRERSCENGESVKPFPWFIRMKGKITFTTPFPAPWSPPDHTAPAMRFLAWAVPPSWDALLLLTNLPSSFQMQVSATSVKLFHASQSWL